MPKGKTAEEFLIEKAKEGLKEKDLSEDKICLERLNYELDVICKKGYAPYFLIVSDILKWAKENQIPTTTRGSAAGSLVGYVTDISTLNPIEFGLPFERFLNPYRPSAPDIDMDFAGSLRDKVIEYSREKYGYEKVANISTFGTMMARGSVRDVTRVLDFSYEFGDRLSKLIPMGAQGAPMTINKALDEVPELKQIYHSDSRAKRVIDLARKVEGCARHVSIHAAGVVIAPTILTDFTPLQRDPSGQGNIITQYEMHAAEDTGLIKFDFLGITNLTILSNAIQIIKKTKDVDINLEEVPLDDEDTFKFISAGHTYGTFQLGGSGMTKWLVELKPTHIKELAAMIALFRPGPMESIPEYIARKQGRKKIEYLDPRLKEILKDTYGVITYQDDLLLIAIELAGYNWKTVDKFRKAVGKKIPELMAEQEKIFIEGCQTHGKISQEKAEALWQLFDPFKGYGFNKAHAASYGLVAYQTAYLKTHYTAEFMTAVMTAESQNTDKLVEAIHECKRLGVKVLPPDVNHSRPDFTYTTDTEIRFGLTAIKNLGNDIANYIIANRKEKGHFKTLEEFLHRIESKNLNKKSLEALIKSGAMDSLGERQKMLHNMDRILDFIRQKNHERRSQQTSLFGEIRSKEKQQELFLEETEPAPLKIKLAWEKELLGLYVSGHPFAETQGLVKNHIDAQCNQLDNLKNTTCKIAGIVMRAQKITTKKNDEMVFVTLGDMSGEVEVIVFPKTYQKTKHIWQEEKHLMVAGKVSDRDETAKLIADEVIEIHNETFSEDVEVINQRKEKIERKYSYMQKMNGSNQNGFSSNFSASPSPTQANRQNSFVPEGITKINIHLPRFFNTQIHENLKNIFQTNPGSYQVFLSIPQNGSSRKIETDFKIAFSPSIKHKLEEIVGNGKIKLE